MGINTDLLHKHQMHAALSGDYKPVARAHVSPIYQTSTYILDDFDSAVYLNQHVDKGFVYSRFGSPNCDELEKKDCQLGTYRSWSGSGQWFRRYIYGGYERHKSRRSHRLW